MSQWRDFTPESLPPLLRAAADCFVESGYHGTTIRQIAARAGLSVPGYYHHYESKQKLLVEIMQSAMEELYARSLAADLEAGSDPARRLAAHIECLALFHAHRGNLAFIASSEIRSLEPEARAAHIARRDRQQHLMDSIVEDGVAAGAFTVAHQHDAVRAIITMCTGISQWYHVGGTLSPADLAVRYVDFGRQMLGAA